MFNITKSFSLLWQATKNSARPMWQAAKVLIYITLVLVVIFCIVEGLAQPKEYGNPLNGIVWAFSQYIGDPGKFAGPGPITVVGRLIAEVIGIVKILIFAVPAGMIGAGYSKALKDEKRKKELDAFSIRLHKRFRRTGQSKSFEVNAKGYKKTYKYVDRYYSFVTMQVKTGMTPDDIIDTVSYCPDMRFINMAQTYRSEDKPEDRIAICTFPLNNEYGCFLDRGSDVTIVAPAACTLIGTGNFAFSLAAMGGFNYVSRELLPDPDDTFSFFTMRKVNLDRINDYDIKEDMESQALHFIDDLKSLKQHSEERGHHHWFIVLMATSKGGHNGQIHLARLATDNSTATPIEVDGKTRSSLILASDESTFMAIYNDIKGGVAQCTAYTDDGARPVGADLGNPSIFKTMTKQNIMTRVGGGTDCNAFDMHITYDILFYNTTHLMIVKAMADAIRKHVDSWHEIPEGAKKSYTEEGKSFTDEEDVYKESFGDHKPISQTPEGLKQMLEEGRRYAREKYEPYNLDGKLQDITDAKAWKERNNNKK